MALNDKLGEEDAGLFDSEINLFIVSPELKGKGLGRKLMDRYVHFCKANGIATAFLWTDVDCDYSFYQKYGFKIHKTFKSAKLLQHGTGHEDGMVFYIVIDQV
ncbi:GNAT family N-acetyltransferase [Photobacterium sanguinicancri]|uniref:GNAT family N-acetyltransferase n=1 Tax=Photobacterium sanguinicancri TaxID=875932 RepID=UPI0024816600|nr:GNAT family N-acetyltransferase [Photobacterium sanguinicancri]